MASEGLSMWSDWSNYKHEYTRPAICILSAAVLILLTWYSLLTKKSRNKKVPLPPGPQGLPIVGILPFLDPNLHTYFDKLAKTYGPIFKVQLGRKLCIVLSSPSVVQEVHKDHDLIFANRDVTALGFAASYDGMDMVWSPYGQNWRMLRKICVQELLSHGRLEALYDLRRREVQKMVKQIYSNAGRPIDIGEYILATMFHLITSVLWGGTLEKEDRERVILEFGKAMDEFFKLLGTPNVSDFFPVLAKFDIQGFERKMKKICKWLDQLFDYVIDQRLRMRSGEDLNNDGKVKDFLQVLLQLKDQGDHSTTFTITHVKTLLLDMLVAATKSSSTSIEWVMTELIKHPEIMKKVQEEIEEVVGINNIVEESYIPKLNYLHAVLKEVMRLHPVAPLLIPRRPSESCTVGSYMVPEGTKIFVNVWAIHRDPECWENPLEFKPERFLNTGNDFDFKSTNFSYMPFGYGRRKCIGIPMAERMVPYLLASMLHSFDWKLPDATKLDLSETLGLELTKTIPLVAIPTPRSSERNKLYT
ncbi:hypothetical protein AQUCO_10200017v1 [Aquilegia coerulea]|uniref:Cytochrome P450 n=1 Tax=Aquilegia coerulea TaxID=218851 RepID=A0A2G5C3X0_AQUCA|nr:hypothetical protein AQUCO_10200017v1 [Aquilegia coerulea]